MKLEGFKKDYSLIILEDSMTHKTNTQTTHTLFDKVKIDSGGEGRFLIESSTLSSGIKLGGNL